METLLVWLDPWFIAPYRWLSAPFAAFFLGTLLLVAQASVLGLISLAIGKKMHTKRLDEWQKKMEHYNTLSEQALSTGDKELYKAVNRQAHDAFGHHFSLGGALFVVSLWPVPFALAWFTMRFGSAELPSLPFSLPVMGDKPSLLFWFLVLYIPARLFVGKCMRVCMPQKA